MFLQVIFSVEGLAAFCTNLIFATRVSDHVTCQMLVALERFATDSALIRPILVVSLLVAIQVFLSLQARATNVAGVRSLLVILEMLVKRLPILKSICALWAVVNQYTFKNRKKERQKIIIHTENRR